MNQVAFAPGVLPVSPAPLLGRTEELAIVCEQLVAREVRLLTLLGPGGVGKTRLALAAAEQLANHPAFPDGVRFVDLSPIQDVSLITGEIQRVLGLRDGTDQPSLDELIERLAGRQLLLVIDNCEHLLAAAPGLGRLLGEVPGLTVLATSREPIRLRWERTLPLAPLAVPDPDPRHLPPPADLAEVPAVALFLDRARAARPGFEVTRSNASDLARLVVRLDGLPLAIEIAAAHAALLGPAALLARLDGHLPLPEGQSVDAPERHRTLGGAIAWSHQTLTPEQQTLYRRLSVFAGGARLEAIDAAAGGAEVPDVFAALVALADKSLLQVAVQPDGQPWFRMLETIREDAGQRLHVSGDEDETRERHASYYVEFARRAERLVPTVEQHGWLERIDQEHDNIRTALRWLLDSGRGSLASRLAGGLGYAWWIQGRVAEGRAWYEEILALQGEGRGRVMSLTWFGLMARGQGDDATADAAAAEAIELAVGLGDRQLETSARFVLAVGASARGDLERARALAQETIECARAAGEPWSLGNALLLTAMNEAPFDPEVAARYFAESLPPFRRVGGPHEIILALSGLGMTYGELGRDEEARARFREALELARGSADPVSGSACAILCLAFLAMRGHAARALPVMRGVRAYMSSIGRTVAPILVVALQRADAEAEDGAQEAPALMVPGEAMEVAAALLDAPAVEPARRSAAAARGLLSARELEVLALVAEGHSNRAIAEALVVSQNTAKFHVASLLNKLGAATRAEAVARASALGLLPIQQT